MIPNLPPRNRTAFRFFFEHQIQLCDEEKEAGLERGSKSCFSKGGFFGHMSSEYKNLDKEGRKVYEDAEK